METMSDISLPSSARSNFIHSISLVAGIDCTSNEILECQARIKEMYQKSGYYQPNVTHEEIPDRKRQKTKSPICVSDYASLWQVNLFTFKLKF